MHSFIQLIHDWPSTHLNESIAIALLAVLVVLLWKRFWYVDLLKDVDKTKYDDAAKAASNRKQEILPALQFTEKNVAWVLLYDHARKGQIDTSIIRRMRKKDLLFLAGMSFPHPNLTRPKAESEPAFSANLRHEEVTKLIGNATRAKMELDRRSKTWTTIITASAALMGAVLGAILTNK